MSNKTKRIGSAIEELHFAVRTMNHQVDDLEEPDRETGQFMLYQALLRLLGETADDMTLDLIISAECEYSASEVLGIRYLPQEKIQ